MDHRKYHWLYFLLGIFIAIIVATLMGCEQPQSTSGVVIERPPVACCLALTPSCMACQEGISEDEWLEYEYTKPRTLPVRFEAIKAYIKNELSQDIVPVSYTHLTLPTNREV